MGALICETVTGQTMAELCARRDAATRADIVELRLDGVEDLDVAGALAGRRAPVVVTCRPTWDGGRFEGAEDTRLAWLAEAVTLGAEYVDVEHGADRSRVPHSERTRHIVSFHDWHGVPSDLTDRVRDMRQSGAMIKVAVTAGQLRDTIRLRDACAGDRADQIVIGMGPCGQLTRVCPWTVHSAWTYAGQAAPGQLTCDALIDRYRVRAGSATTTVYGVAGRPVAHSASPAMHNAAFAALGLDAVYVAFESESADEVLAVADAFGVAGLSVTAPLKRDVLALCESVEPRAASLGAVNTLRRTGAGWAGENFDVDGFLDPLDRRGVRVDKRRTLVIGAGGAARAVARALTERGAHVTVAARRDAAASRLAVECEVEATGWPPLGVWDLVVNATPVGTWPHESARPPLPAVGPGALAYDLVYNPPDTLWQRDARAAGADAIGGLDMLVDQACRQFAWWTGRSAPRSVMQAAADAFVTREIRTPA